VTLADLRWTCHVCGDERPDALIGVFTRRLRSRSIGVELSENVRHCTDRPECVAGARETRFLSAGDYEVVG
jgi:hypothetical protein